MICPGCKTRNPESARYCSNCGRPLVPKPAPPPRRTPWYSITAGVVAAAVVIYFAFTPLSGRKPRTGGERENTPSPAGTAELQPAAERTETAAPPTGYVVFLDVGGTEVARFPAPVLDGDWAGAPSWLLINASAAEYESPDLETSAIAAARWQEGDPFVLVRLEKATLAPAPLKLARWRQNLPLEWRALEDGGSALIDEPMSPERTGSFFCFSVREEMRRPGILLQEGRVTGWTPGRGVDRAYLYSGAVPPELAPNTDIATLINASFSGARESGLARAASLEGRAPAAEELQAFAEAFTRQPVSRDEDKPPSLRDRFAVMRMHLLALELKRLGLVDAAARSLNDAVLLQAGDMDLIKDSFEARLSKKGHEAAIAELEGLRRAFAASNRPAPADLNGLLLGLYKDWLKRIIDGGAYARGDEAYERARLAFPDDPELHLLGVEIYILEKQWARATELLQQRSYPAYLNDRARFLEVRVQEGRRDEGAVIIRFDPAKNYIPVEAYVNGTTRMNFFIDTGATTSSIPSDMLDTLGIKIDDQTKVVAVSGATGVGITYEVTLDTVEIMGQKVHNVKAFVLDLPSHPDHGVLGNNFLNNFYLEIDNKKGILRLKKR
jgi:clan AA aspartic protease (TIGR02281 family)